MDFTLLARFLQICCRLSAAGQQPKAVESSFQRLTRWLAPRSISFRDSPQNGPKGGKARFSSQTTVCRAFVLYSCLWESSKFVSISLRSHLRFSHFTHQGLSKKFGCQVQMVKYFCRPLINFKMTAAAILVGLIQQTEASSPCWYNCH